MKKCHKLYGLAALLLASTLFQSGCSNSGNAVSVSNSETTETATVAVSQNASENTTENDVMTLTIVHVNDIHGYVEETDNAIGYPKIAELIEQMKAEDPNTLALDAGDTFAGTPNAAFDKGESVAAVLNTISFDAFTAGNNDFYLGKPQMEKLAGILTYPTLAGNVTDLSGNHLWERYTIKEMPNGLKVGIVSATCGNDPELIFEDPISSLQRDVDEIREEVDIVIALLHLGYEDASGNTSLKVAGEVTGIDVIIDAHSHTVLEEGHVENGIMIAQTGEYSNNVGVVKLEIQVDGQIIPTARLITKEEMMSQNEKTETGVALNELLAKSDEYFSQVIGQTEVELMGERNVVRTQETNLGNMVTDAVREVTGADVVIAKAGSIGGVIPPGDVTKRDVLAIARISVDFGVFEVTGAELWQFLNDSYKAYPEPGGGFAQVSGLKLVIDPAQPEENRIHTVSVNSEPLDMEKVYTLATSPLDMEGIGVMVENGFPPSEEIIEAYIVKNSPVNPQEEGRITEGSQP